MWGAEPSHVKMAVTRSKEVSPFRSEMQARALVFMALLAVQFGTQPFVNRYFASRSCTPTSLVIVTEVCVVDDGFQ